LKQDAARSRKQPVPVAAVQKIVAKAAKRKANVAHATIVIAVTTVIADSVAA
jgi:hypothetical protein